MSCGKDCKCSGKSDGSEKSTEMDQFSMKLNKIAVARQNVEVLFALSREIDTNTELAKDASDALVANVKALKDITSL